MNPLNRAARVAGLWYLSIVLVGPFSLMYVPDKLIVRGDAAATAHNVLAHEALFRAGIVADLLGSILFIMVGLMLYRLLHGVSKTWAWVMLAFVLVSAAVGFSNVLHHLGALTLFLGADFLSVFDQPQRDALGYLFLRLYSQGISMNELFWGFWLLPFGVLVAKSGFLPRFLGYWLVVNCFAWVAVSLAGLLAPPYSDSIYRSLTPVFFGEIAIMLWLIIKGAKGPAAESARGQITRVGASA